MNEELYEEQMRKLEEGLTEDKESGVDSARIDWYRDGFADALSVVDILVKSEKEGAAVDVDYVFERLTLCSVEL